MADDLIELNIAARYDGVKQALTTVTRLERELIKATKAVESGTMSQKRFNQVLQSAKNQYKDYAGNAGLATININKFVAAQKSAISATDQVTTALNRNSNALQQTKRGTNQLGVLFQQSGYQIGDFAVQVQSGTNVMVAFGQQATQLVGTFAMLARSTTAIAAFSTLGIVIPIATALAGAFMRARDSADDLGKSVKDVFDSIVARSASIGDLLEVTFTGSLEVARQQLVGIQEVFQKLDQQTFLAKLREGGSELNVVLGEVNDKLAENAQLIRLQESGRLEGDDRFQVDLVELKKQQDALNEFKASIGVAFTGPPEEMAKAFVDAYTTLQGMSSVVAGDIAPEFKKLLEDTGLLTQFEKELTEAAKAQAKEKREQATETAKLISDSLANSDRETAALERRNDAIEGFKTKYNKLTEAQMDGELGVNEATRRAREELELINLARANNIKLTGTEYQQLVQILRTYQAQRKEAEDNLEITRIKKDATDALVQAEFKVLQAEVDLLRAKDKNTQADKLSVKLAGDRAYQAIMAKAETEEEAAALQDAANEARELAIEAARVANGTRDAKEEAQELAKATREAERAMSALANMGDNLDKGLIKAQARVQALKNDADAANAAVIAGATFDLEKTYEDALFAAESFDEVIQATKEYNEGLATLDATAKALAEGKKLEEAARNGKKAMDDAAKSAEELADKIRELEDAADPFRAYNRELKELDKMLDKNQISQKAYNKAVDDLNEGLGDTISIVGDVEQAFADWMRRGFDDFKSFVGSIKDMFINLLADMAAAALRNRILIPITTGMAAGFGSSAAASTVGSGMGSFAAGTIGSTLAAGAFGLGQGVSAALGIGGFASQGLFNIGANAAVASAAGASPLMATIGAALPAIAAVAAVVGLLTKKTKELDNGLQVTVDGMQSLVETFRVTQSSRLFGLLKGRKKTTMNEIVEGPLVDAVNMMQQSVLGLAETLGFGASTFDNFSYEFKLSLKGMTEEEQLQALQEELLKMADSMAELVPLVGSFNELAAVAQERVTLENQLLQAEGDIVELRKRELATVHILNQELAARLHVLQAEANMQGALGAFAAGIAEQQGLIRRAVDALVKPLQDAIDRTKTQAEKSYAIFREAAAKARTEAQTLVDIIRNALDSRTLRSEPVERMRYTVAQQQLAEFAAGGAYDEVSLKRAVEGVSIDSSKFFGSFEDYARDFYKTQISLSELEAKAAEELTEVEQQIEIAEQQYQVSMGTYQEIVDLNTAIQNLAADLNIYDATLTANQPLIKTITSTGETQIETLDAVLVEVTKQVNALLGIETSMADLVGSNVSIGEALGVLGFEASGLAGSVLGIDAVVTDLQGNVSDLGLYVVGLDGTALKLDTSVFKLGSNVSNLDGTVTGLYGTVTGLDGTVSNLDGTVTGLDGTVTGLDGTVVGLDGTVDELSADVVTLFGGINLLDGTVDGFGIKIDKLGIHTDDLGIDINNLGTTLSDAMSGLGSTVTSLTGAIGQLAASQNALASAQQAQSAASSAATKALADKAIEDIEAQAANINVPEEIKIVSTTARGSGGGIFGLFKSDKSSYVTVSGDASEFGAIGSGTQFHSKTGDTATEVATATTMAEAAIAKRNEQIATANASLEELRNQIIELGGTPTFAMGGMHSGGLRLVGERGPELEVTGPSRIYNKRDTMAMLSGASSETAAEIRMLRREVSELRAEQRKIGVENVKYNKKNYDLNREWDIVGLPATRTA